MKREHVTPQIKRVFVTDTGPRYLEVLKKEKYFKRSFSPAKFHFFAHCGPVYGTLFLNIITPRWVPMLVSSTSPRWDKNILFVVLATARVSKALTRVPFVQLSNGWYCLSRVAVGVAGHDAIPPS
ncbi:hypothetical protein CEXT_697001 [Caerostris extrusa]|uniref:Uncharacterized protein n=1 Tax=Caerostris extrusa TaxID=172846 RepID=A0AAV4Y9R6_CAEEX|nr:hypothetical protein CEXT_697001 [Caerostris extrusa]